MSFQSSSSLALPPNAHISSKHVPITQQPLRASTMSVASSENQSGVEETEKARRLRGGCIPCPDGGCCYIIPIPCCCC
ncbi:hypothetical protein PILCRDRAFT_814669 [Piloderma croceum F 1598]|uniref:Uncharacterized protein n=1 Tax=Piloderma croceum (strain F 1598) TaxID=765440 RepID=A0A0C3FUD3_PILCF|nr:hypothetical protein PILCRDRAFT_814669 [Piloderma croceum F 1598]